MWLFGKNSTSENIHFKRIQRHNQTSCFGLLFTAHNLRGLQQGQVWAAYQIELLKTIIKSKTWSFLATKMQYNANKSFCILLCVVFLSVNTVLYILPHLVFHLMYQLAWKSGFSVLLAGLAIYLCTPLHWY